ncbi:MAG: putative poly(beta-D-mannuronate) O-acetylase [Oscillospiraceae bacterium]|nr:putative poly(beta-D-mannuronate) O-acetylase [Oscillospiraceae bacterium]
MVFSSPLFLFFYLPVVLAAYHSTPNRYKNLTLLLFSLVFYAWGEPVYIFVMLASITVNYLLGRLVYRFRKRQKERKARLAVAGSVVFNLALLFFFKYWDFTASNLAAIGLGGMSVFGLALPIGISFYTFQIMSYTIDVYRGDAPVQKNFINIGIFVTMFPHLMAGPILLYKDMDAQINSRQHSAEKFASGVQIFIIGLAKKVLLANNIGKLWDVYSAMPASQLTVAGAWLGAIAFSLQIYFDFCGYSEMAIGLGRMLGFELKRNFDYPYVSKSVTEFWRRWHISLSSWFRDYVYIPLGGNRVGVPRLCVNLLIVWGLTGIWHGASWNFLLWGLYYGVLLIAEKLLLKRLLDRLPAAFGHLYTLLLVVIGWAIFSIEDFGSLLGYLRAMFGMAAGGLFDSAFLYYIVSYLPTLAVLGLASVPLGAQLWNHLPSTMQKAALPLLLLAGMVLCTAYLVDATYNPFLYFRF